MEISIKAAAIVSATVFLAGTLWIAGLLSPRAKGSPRIGVLAMSRSGGLLASGTSGGEIRIWDLKTNKVIRNFPAPEGPLNDLQFTPDEKYLAVANRNITLISVRTSDPPMHIRQDEANYGTVRFTEDGQSILSIIGLGEIAIFDVPNGRQSLKVCCSTIYGEVAFANGDSRIVAAGHWPSIWDRESGALRNRLTATRETMTFGPIALNRSQTTVYMGSQDGRVHRWDLRTGIRRGISAALNSYVTTISVLGNSGWIAYATRGESVYLWNSTTGESKAISEAKATSNLCFDEASQLTAFGKETGEIEFWDLPGEKCVRTLPAGR